MREAVFSVPHFLKDETLTAHRQQADLALQRNDRWSGRRGFVDMGDDSVDIWSVKKGKGWRHGENIE